ITVSEIVAPVELERALPEGLPPRHWAFAAKAVETVPAQIVAALPGGRAVGHYGAVVTPDDTLLFDLSPYYGAFDPTQHPIFLRPWLPPVHDEAGSVGVLTTRGVDNYYHFLTDVLPRIELLRRAGHQPDRYLVNRVTRFQVELLDRLGIGDAMVVQSAAVPHLRAERLLVPSVPDSHLRAPPWVTAWLRATLLPDDQGPARRLYVSRGDKPNTRRVENEAEVLAALAPYGFEVIDPGGLSVQEQVRRFAEAELVVAPHGAALTNLVFCPPGAAVIELFPPDYVNVCYWALADTVPGLRYRYLVGDGRPGPDRRASGVASDVRVDPGVLVGLVDDALR
ncbi:MAG TPA: glycosyltransferase family 61 protein, partial [Acidimicrobiales bacterium]|nr:glycosyltransferase family 61 protein [Acidimicrobiales bacterium]